VESSMVVMCSKCQLPIASGDGWSFVCFKIPAKEGYYFFHRRFCSGDCWEGYLKERE
jgi:hypothetical protein